MKQTIINQDNKNVGECELEPAVFGGPVNKPLLYEVVKMWQANQRSGLACCRNHALVSGTTKKMYRQKGTGRARHGDQRVNLFVGGGKAFGPKPRDYTYHLPRRARQEALKSVLALKYNEGRLLVMPDLELKGIKTKVLRGILNNIGAPKALIVLAENNAVLEKSARNIPNVQTVRFNSLNVRDILQHEHLVITKAALFQLQDKLKALGA